MKQIGETKRIPSAETIARMADRGENISKFFTNDGKMHGPVQSVTVDFTSSLLGELDQAAGELNVSRQALIKTFVRQALDQHYLASRAKKTG